MILLIEQVKNRSQQIENLLKTLGVPFALWSAYKQSNPPFCNYSHIIIGGGTLNVEEIDNSLSFLYREKLFLERHLESSAILGICLGAEILAKIVNHQITTIYRQKGLKEIFLTESGKKDFLFTDLTDLRFYFNHRRQVVPSSKNLEILAQDKERNLAAFRLKDKRVWGVQFHPESTSQGANLIKNFLKAS